MRKSGNRFSDAIKFTQIAQAYLHIPLYFIGIDHVYDFGLKSIQNHRDLGSRVVSILVDCFVTRFAEAVVKAVFLHFAIKR